MSANNAANFGRVCSLIPMRGVETKFKIDAVKEFTLDRIRMTNRVRSLKRYIKRCRCA